jgi:hypothetical protein
MDTRWNCWRSKADSQLCVDQARSPLSALTCARNVIVQICTAELLPLNLLRPDGELAATSVLISRRTNQRRPRSTKRHERKTKSHEISHYLKGFLPHSLDFAGRIPFEMPDQYGLKRTEPGKLE